jgi:hypothetical protein
MENIMKRKSFPIFGILLIVIGSSILLDRLYIIHFGWYRIWPTLLAVLGLWMVINSFIYEKRGKIFGGTFIFLLGVLFVLKNFNIIYMRYDIFWPALFLILGLSFLMLFIFEPKDWGVLIPSIIFIGFGLFVIFTRLGYFYYWEIWDLIGMYWPVILIIIGVSMLLTKKKE